MSKTKTNFWNVKSFIILAFIVLLILLFLPILIYGWHFDFPNFSDKNADWGTFGDYYGGVLNPIIGILNLIILTIITSYVAKFSGKEALKQQFIVKRLEAYQNLVSFIPKFNMLSGRLDMYNSQLDFIGKVLNQVEEGFRPPFTSKDIYEITSRIQLEYNILLEMHYCIFNFNVCYGHLFEYDFDCENFQKLLESSKRNLGFYKNLQNQFVGEKLKTFSNDEFMDNLTEFLNALREEMELPK